MEIARVEEATDFCWGLTFLGTGGGGRVEAGLDMLLPVINAGGKPRIVSADLLPPDALTCWAIIVGGKDPDSPPPSDELESFNLTREAFPTIVPRLVEAVKQLSEYADVRIDALVSMELSSAATVATMLTAHELGIPILDSDYVGRAIPELPLTKLELIGLPPTPVIMVDRWGNITIVKHASGAAMTDRLGRMVSRAAYGRGIATVGHLLPIAKARPALVSQSLPKAMEIGSALRSRDLSLLKTVTKGHLLFEGRVSRVDWRNTEPYTFRELDYHFEGTGSFANSRLRIWIKNEHHIVWKDDDVLVTSPDVVAVLNPETLKPLTTLGDVQVDNDVIVFGMPALDNAWWSRKGSDLLGPRHFGFDFDAVPL